VTFQRAQIVTEQVRSRGWDTAPVYPWPLTGAIRCWCGAAMHGQAGGHFAPGKRIRYYRCNAPARHGASRGARADAIEAQFSELLSALKDNGPEAYRRTPVGPDPELLDRAIRAARAELDALSRDRAEVWDLRSSGVIRTEDVQERLDALAVKRDEVARRIAELEHQRAATAVVRSEAILTRDALAKMVRLWQNPSVSAKTRRDIAVAVAVHVGGLYVGPDGELTRGTPATAPAEHRRRGAHRA
jgi:hypothetical protein